MPQSPLYARMGVCLSLLLCLSACSFLKPSPTIAEISATASAKINMDARGRATPVAIRIYVLKNTTAFGASDFFTLYEKEQQTLGDSLISREEALLQPGETKVFQAKTLEPGAQLGVIAAFRNIDKANWRSTVTPIGGKTNDIRVTVNGDSVAITAAAK